MFGNIPVDHRLSQRLPLCPIKSSVDRGTHAAVYAQYGRSLQGKRASPVTDAEIEFGTALAGPSTRGGLLVVLQQPAPSQRYTGNFDEDVMSCATLQYLDEALRLVGYGSLEDISCFDAFPFYLEETNPDRAPLEMRQAYKIFKEMVRLKRPDVIITAWKAPRITEFQQFGGKGVGAANGDRNVMVDEHCIRLVNAFHPSYAVNYNPNESCFHQLFLLELATVNVQAEPWMRKLRNICRQRTREIRNQNS